jgi:hypothetical protein
MIFLLTFLFFLTSAKTRFVIMFSERRKKAMAQYLQTAFRNFIHGAKMFVRPAVRKDLQEDLPPPQSIDRYFANVGARLISARNRFEHEYIGDTHADA